MTENKPPLLSAHQLPRHAQRPPRRQIRRSLAAAVLVGALGPALAGCTGTTFPTFTSSSPSPSSSPQSSGGASDTSEAGLPAVPRIVQEVEPSVVTIRTAIGLGSGVVYHDDGVIVTDAHVVENQQKVPFKTVEVQFADGSSSKGTVVGVDDLTDVAVVKTDRSDLPAPTYAQDPPEVGSMAVVIGSPLGLVGTVTAGIVSALHRNMPPSQESPQGLINLIQTDAPISPGNSGGAVVNAKSEVIGLSEAYLPPSSGAVAIGFVTPSSIVTDVADQLLQNGEVRHAFLGVLPKDITPQIAQRFGLQTTSGALVIDVGQGTPAAEAGIKPGDIITKFAGDKVASVTDLLAAIRKADPGQKVDITIQRGKDSETVSARLSDQPNQ